MVTVPDFNQRMVLLFITLFLTLVCAYVTVVCAYEGDACVKARGHFRCHPQEHCPPPLRQTLSLARDRHPWIFPHPTSTLNPQSPIMGSNSILI